MIAGIVYAPSAGARGYLIFGTSLFIYCFLGGMIAKGIKKTGWIRVVTVIIFRVFCFHLNYFGQPHILEVILVQVKNFLPRV